MDQKYILLKNTLTLNIEQIIYEQSLKNRIFDSTISIRLLLMLELDLDVV